MPYPVNPVGFNPMFQASMPNDYTNPTNFGSYGGGNPSQSGWGLNTSYLTPSFLAPYRPQYAGNANFQMPTMSFGRALNTAITTPWQPDTPHYANPQMYQARAASEVGNKISDGAMAAGQFVIPVAIGLATAAAVDSFRFSGGAQADVSRMAYGFRSSMPSWLGGASTLTQASYLARSQTLMEAGGHWAGRTAGRTVGLAVHGAVQSAAYLLSGGRTIGGLSDAAGVSRLGAFGARAAGFAGAAAGSLLAPFAFGEAVSEGVDFAAFAPYVAGRQTSNMVQDSLRGTYTGMGSAASPIDVTSRNATRLGFSLSRTFTENNAFGMEASADIFAGASSAGLFKGTSFNPTDMKKRMKDVTQSISLMMSVFNDPSTQEAIDRLRQLQEGAGLKSIDSLSALSMKYRMASATTGIGTRELMAGVGNQGQLMYAQAGLMPHLGQYAALNAMSGITSAYRNGLVSSTSLAMMGGAEGASQLSMQAQIGLSRTPYFEMVAYNKYASGIGDRGLVGNVSAFGTNMARNPIKGYGGYLLNKDITTSSMLRDDPGRVLDQLIERAHDMGQVEPDGTVSIQTMTALASSMGIGPDMMRALFTEMRGKEAERASGSGAAAFQSSEAAYRSQQGVTYYGSSSLSVGRIGFNLKGLGRDIQDWGSRNTENMAMVGANISDGLAGMAHGMSNNAGLDVTTYKYDKYKVNNELGRGINYANLALGGAELAAGVGGTVVAGVAAGSGFGLPVTAGLGLPSLYTAAQGGSRIFNEFANGMRSVSDGPSSSMAGTISQIRQAVADKKLALPNGSSQQDIYSIAKVIGSKDLDSVREAMTWIKHGTAQQGTTDLYQNFMNSAASTATSNIRDLTQRHFYSPGTWKDGNSRYSTNLEKNVAALPEEKRLALAVFAHRNNGSMGDPGSFVVAALAHPYIVKILTELGYGEAFTGSGPEATATARRAMIALAAITTVGGLKDPKMEALTQAAHSVTPEGSIGAIDLNKVKNQLLTSMGEVSSNLSKFSVGAGDVAALKRDPGAQVARYAGLKAVLDSAGQSTRMKAMSGWEGLMMASTDTQTAAKDIKEAAALLKEAVTGGGATPLPGFMNDFMDWSKRKFGTPAAQPATVAN